MLGFGRSLSEKWPQIRDDIQSKLTERAIKSSKHETYACMCRGARIFMRKVGVLTLMLLPDARLHDDSTTKSTN
jgi:hypothetical protein